MTAGQKTASEITALLKARNALLWVSSPEEGRAERGVIDAAAAAKYECALWDCAAGVTDALGKELFPGEGTQDVASMLARVRDSKKRAVWVLKDIAPWLRDPNVMRALRNLARSLPSSAATEARSIVVLSPTADIPPELSDHAIAVKWPLPDRAEIATILDQSIESLPGAVSDGERDAAIEAAVGLTAEAAASCYAKSLVTQKRRIVPAVISAEKRRVINQSKGIEWFEPDPRGLDAIGGLDNLKPWLLARKGAFTQEARDFGLPVPKGMMLIGVPGCGKSLSAKATATAFECPLLRADFGSAQSKWVGESQANIRGVFAVAEAVGKCVLWIDEIEKALAGATSGAADGGVAADALGTFLQWMQEKTGPVFVIATANDVTKLPPELLRKGRWDELFFVDLPTASERREIATVVLKKYKRDASAIALDEVVAATDGFTGAEIDALAPEALFTAFADGKRDIRTSDLLAAARATVPLSKTAADKIAALREWAKGRARPASRGETQVAARSGRALDM